jgi:GNAT superfamily N-acetyltransferase
MARTLAVREATVEDLANLSELWEDLTRTYAKTAAEAAGLELLRRRVAGQLADGECGGVRLTVAYDGDAPVGLVLTRRAEWSTWRSAPCVVIEALHVVPGHRRSGVARALLGAAVEQGDRAGADELLVTVPHGARDANRFFARFGFGAETTVRRAPIGVLRRRLGGGVRADVVVRRRRLGRAQLAAQPE